MSESKQIWKSLNTLSTISFDNNLMLFNPLYCKINPVKTLPLKEEIESKKEIFQIKKEQSTNSNTGEPQKTFIKKGRKCISELKSEEDPLSNTHSKFIQDNIKRKIKTHFHFFLIAFLNKKIKEEFGFQKYKIRKIESSITQDISILANKNLFQTSLKDILINVSKKFNDRESNKNYINKIILTKPELKSFFDMNYKDFYLNYYLTSDKSTFEGFPKDESFEAHLNSITARDGIIYAAKFKENAINFITDFERAKQKIRRKRPIKEEEIAPKTD